MDASSDERGTQLPRTWSRPQIAVQTDIGHLDSVLANVTPARSTSVPLWPTRRERVKDSGAFRHAAET